MTSKSYFVTTINGIPARFILELDGEWKQINDALLSLPCWWEIVGARQVDYFKFIEGDYENI